MENISGFWPSTAAPSANDNDEGSFDDGDTLRLGSPSPQRAWNELEPPQPPLERPLGKGGFNGKKRPASESTAPKAKAKAKAKAKGKAKAKAKAKASSVQNLKKPAAKSTSVQKKPAAKDDDKEDAESKAEDFAPLLGSIFSSLSSSL